MWLCSSIEFSSVRHKCAAESHPSGATGKIQDVYVLGRTAANAGDRFGESRHFALTLVDRRQLRFQDGHEHGVDVVGAAGLVFGVVLGRDCPQLHPGRARRSAEHLTRSIRKLAGKLRTKRFTRSEHDFNIKDRHRSLSTFRRRRSVLGPPHDLARRDRDCHAQIGRQQYEIRDQAGLNPLALAADAEQIGGCGRDGRQLFGQRGAGELA
jgi:hypothetical protein